VVSSARLVHFSTLLSNMPSCDRTPAKSSWLSPSPLHCSLPRPWWAKIRPSGSHCWFTASRRGQFKTLIRTASWTGSSCFQPLECPFRCDLVWNNAFAIAACGPRRRRSTGPSSRQILPCKVVPALRYPAIVALPGTECPDQAAFTFWLPGSRAVSSAADITCAVEAASMTRVAWWTSAFGIDPKPQSG
jgi:hypothetical protein